MTSAIPSAGPSLTPHPNPNWHLQDVSTVSRSTTAASSPLPVPPRPTPKPALIQLPTSSVPHDSGIAQSHQASSITPQPNAPQPTPQLANAIIDPRVRAKLHIEPALDPSLMRSFLRAHTSAATRRKPPKITVSGRDHGLGLPSKNSSKLLEIQKQQLLASTNEFDTVDAVATLIKTEPEKWSQIRNKLTAPLNTDASESQYSSLPPIAPSSEKQQDIRKIQRLPRPVDPQYLASLTVKPDISTLRPDDTEYDLVELPFPSPALCSQLTKTDGKFIQPSPNKDLFIECVCQQPLRWEDMVSNVGNSDNIAEDWLAYRKEYLRRRELNRTL